MTLRKSYTVTNITSNCFAWGLFVVVLQNINETCTFFKRLKQVKNEISKHKGNILSSQLCRSIFILSELRKLVEPLLGDFLKLPSTTVCAQIEERDAALANRDHWITVQVPNLVIPTT